MCIRDSSNQILAAADFDERITAPVFLTGAALSVIAVVTVELFYLEYKERLSFLAVASPFVSTRVVILTRLLQAVMLLALAGSAWYGASEVVEIN